MAEITYTTVPGRLKQLLPKIRSMGVPAKMNRAWLTSVGFPSGNDASTIPVLKLIGFVDQAGAPTDDWKKYRGSDYPKVLGDCIRRGYADLFATYPTAESQPTTDIENFFAARSTAGQQAIRKAVATFSALCELATFNGTVSGEQTPPPVQPDPNPPAKTEQPQSKPAFSAPGTTVNINVQLTLPETTNDTVYEKLFAAMRKHLMAGA